MVHIYPFCNYFSFIVLLYAYYVVLFYVRNKDNNNNDDQWFRSARLFCKIILLITEAEPESRNINV